MKKSVCLALVLIMLASLLVSCGGPLEKLLLKTNSPGLLLTACFYLSVPGFYQRDLKGYSPDTVETDQYGRTLLCFTSYNNLSKTTETAYAICQKYADSTVYFYEDINYIRIEFTQTKSIDSKLEELKERNDWNRPFDEKKCSVRKIEVSIDMVYVTERPSSPLSTEEYYSRLYQTDGITKEAIVSNAFCDSDGKKCVLYYLTLKNGAKYFYVMDTDGNLEVEKINDPYDCTAEIRALKQRSGWHYGP